MGIIQVVFLVVFLSMPGVAHAKLFGLLKDAPQAHNTLIEAVDLGNREYVKQLLANGYPVNAVDANGQTALMKAALRGNEGIVKALVDAGADVNFQDKLGNTALHYASAHDHIAASDTLLKNGAATNIKNKSGKTALQEALSSKSVNVAKLIDPASLVAVESEAFLPVAAAAGAGISTKAIVAGVAVAGAGGAAAAAGGGGGGGGGGSSTPSAPAPAPTVPSNPAPAPSTPTHSHTSPSPVATDVPGSPSTYEGFEYFNSRSDYSFLNGSSPTVNNGLSAIKASTAYSRGFSGSGVIVAVVDSGVDLSHPDLAANILNSGRDFVNSDNNARDDNGHGTHVAGIIAAVRGTGISLTDSEGHTFATNLNMQGVAYGAKILPVKVMSASGSGSSTNIALGVDYAVANGAKVINLSLGGSDIISGVNPFPDITTSISNAMQHLYSNGQTGALVFAAAGNESGADPIWPAQNAATLNGTVATGAVIAVGSVNSSNSISSFSNRCGIAKDWCLVAPGENIHSTYWNGGSTYTVASGTSMATPFVSGAAAILLQKFPTSNPRLIALKLLNTATDLGDVGVDTTYGHGLLNLDAATDPLGTLSVPSGGTVGGGGSGVSGSSIILSSAFGGSLPNSNIEFMALDSYNFNYNMNLNSVTSNNMSRTSASDSFEEFAEPVMSKVQMADIGGNLSLGFGSEDSKILPDQAGQVQGQTSYFSMVSEAEGMKQAVNYNIPVAQYFGFGAVKDLDGSTFLGDANHGNPYLALVSDGISSVASFAFNDGKFHTNFAMFDGENQDTGYAASGFAGEVAAQFGGASVASQVGMVNEKESFLGSHSSGAFAIGGDSTPTIFYNFSGSLDVAKNTRLFGVFSQGFTSPEDAAGSLINSVSSISSQSFAGGIMFDENFFEDDTLGFAISSPLHVTSGSASIDVPSGVDLSGNILRSNQALNLASGGVETDLEMFYKVPVELGVVSVGAMRRMQPNNIDNAASEDLMVFKFVNKF